jgi:hypothetical protein
MVSKGWACVLPIELRVVGQSVERPASPQVPPWRLLLGKGKGESPLAIPPQINGESTESTVYWPRAITDARPCVDELTARQEKSIEVRVFGPPSIAMLSLVMLGLGFSKFSIV